jgi:cyclopropane fatty-acyl-phospholipid synthase-like methyltransferase
MSETSQYIHGTTPDEQARLSRLNNLLNSRSVEAMDLRGGEKILDVGSGLGQLTRAMARAAGVKVIGIERSEQQIAEAQRQVALGCEETLVEFRQGDYWRALDNDRSGFAAGRVI